MFRAMFITTAPTRVSLAGIACCLMTCLPMLQCTPASQQATAQEAAQRPPQQSNPSIRQLALPYCSSCHAFPEPELLDRSTWEQVVLPRMGYFLGHFPDDSTRKGLLEPGEAGERVLQAQVFPTQPLISDSLWARIQAFYLERAPDSLSCLPTDIAPSTDRFRAHVPEHRFSPPSTTLIKITDRHTLFMGDAHTKRLYHFDAQLKLLQAANVREGAVALHSTPQALWVTVMGSFSPTDLPNGLLIALPERPNERPKVVLQGLQRPVHTAFGDLNEDGREDLVVCEFGKWTGRLAWWEATPDGGYQRHVLAETPGATRVYLEDLDQDGRSDVIALFGQGDERIVAFFNQGAGIFHPQPLLQFPPSWGSSYFELVDANEDGMLDILYTAGDNADYPPLLKPYHGIRLYLNQGKLQFEEAFFYALPGAYKAILRDFDRDGDKDVAAISFFPDFHRHPEQGFVYLENQGEFQFEAASFPEVGLGRWISMDAGDLDGDGDEDLVLGSLTFEVIPKGEFVKNWVDKGIPFIILENQTDEP